MAANQLIPRDALAKRANSGTSPRLLGHPDRCYTGAAMTPREKHQKKLDKAVRLMREQRFAEARPLVGELTKGIPQHPLVWNMAGIVASELGKPERAIPHFEKAVALAPDAADFHNNLGEALRQSERTEESVPHFETALRLEPQHGAAHNNLGVALGELHRGEEAAPHFAAALELRPENPETLANLGIILMKERKPDKAVPCLKRALALKPENSVIQRYLGRALEHADRYEEALTLFERAGTSGEDGTIITVDQVNNLERQGRFDEAWRRFEPLLDSAPEDPSVVTEFAVLAKRLDRRQEARDRIVALLDDHELDDETRQVLYFRLGDLNDSLGLYDDAFDAYARGNALDSRPYDHANQVRDAAANERVYNAGWREGLAQASNTSEVPVFIVGMPRSGTSLVEAILASHPAVHGAGELSDIPNLSKAMAIEMGGDARFPDCMADADQALLDRFAEAHLERLAALSSNAERTTDKLPHNHRHLGLIAQLFPRARIIHCTRDPIDTCLSCYFQNFFYGLGFAHDLASLGAQHRLYERLMAHWQGDGGIELLEVSYEELVADQERVSRQMIAFLGLPWDDACLAFHSSSRRTLTASYDQVRQPIYRGSVKRHEHYAAHLAPLVEALASPAVDDPAWEDANAAARLFETAAEAHRNGDLTTAETLYRNILARAPRHAPTLMQLGLLEQGKGKGQEALEHFRMAARVEPKNASVRNALGQALLKRGEAKEGEQEFRAATAADPAFAGGHHNLGLAVAAQGRFDEALGHFRKGLEHEPDDARGLTHLGQALAETGDLPGAELVLARAAQLQPTVPQIRLALGDVLMQAGKLDAALAAYRELHALVPGEPAGARRLATALQQTGEVEQAVAVLERTRDKAPTSGVLLCELANAYAFAGRDEAAAATFRTAARRGAAAAAACGLAALDDQAGARVLLAGLSGDEPELALARAETAGPAELASARDGLEAALARDDLPGVLRSQLLFALARARYRLGEAKAALETAHEANRLKGVRLDLAAETALVERLIAAFPAGPLVALAPNEPRPLFVVGMQRSGMRLVERMLASHSRIKGLGPAGLLHASARSLGGQGFGYLDDMAALAGEGGATVATAHRTRLAERAPSVVWAVEAVPGNVFHLGLAQSLFPDARVVICHRDPLDAGLACYFEDFAGASPYAYDLGDIGGHARNVARLLDHWRQVLALPVHEIAFADLLDRPTEAAAALLRFLDLAEEAACAAIVDRQRAMCHEGAQRLGEALAPLAAALAEPEPTRDTS